MSLPFVLDHPTVGFGTITAPRFHTELNRVSMVALAALRWLAVTIVAVACAPLLLLLFSVTYIAHGKLDPQDKWLRPVAKVIDWAKNPLEQEKGILGLSPAVIAFNEAHGPKPGMKAQADVLVINNVEETFRWKQRLIQTATQSIEWSLNYAGGEPFQLCLKLIAEQMTKQPDLKVHLILSDDLLTKEDYKILRKMKKEFKNLFAMITSRNPQIAGGFRYEENHVKLLIVDGKYFSFGGTGVQDQMVRETLKGDEKRVKRSLSAAVMDLCFRDTDIFGQCDAENNIAETMRGQFFNLYRIWAKRGECRLRDSEGCYSPLDKQKGVCESFHSAPHLIKNTTLRFIVGGPEHAGRNPINHALMYHFQQAKRVIRIANLLFNPSKRMRAAFQQSSAKKVGHFNSTTKNHSASRFAFAQLTRQNYHLFHKIHEYDGQEQLYHKKVVLIDDTIAYVGSYNFGTKSDRCDYEITAIFEDERVASVLKEGLKQDAARSILIRPKPKRNLRSKFHAFPFNLVSTILF